MNVVYLWLLLYQGGWENDETVEEAACREALEEAGVKGIIKVSLHLHMCYIGVWAINPNDAWIKELLVGLAPSSKYRIVL